MAYKATRQYFFVSTSELKMVGIMPPLQPPQGPAHPRAGAHAAALHSLCAQSLGGLHFAQPPHPGRPDGVFDGACAKVFAAVGVRVWGRFPVNPQKSPSGGATGDALRWRQNEKGQECIPALFWDGQSPHQRLSPAGGRAIDQAGLCAVTTKPLTGWWFSWRSTVSSTSTVSKPAALHRASTWLRLCA